MSLEVLYVATATKDGESTVFGELGVEYRSGTWFSVLTINGEPYAGKEAPTRAAAVCEVERMREAANRAFAVDSRLTAATKFRAVK